MRRPAVSLARLRGGGNGRQAVEVNLAHGFGEAVFGRFGKAAQIPLVGVVDLDDVAPAAFPVRGVRVFVAEVPQYDNPKGQVR